MCNLTPWTIFLYKLIFYIASGYWYCDRSISIYINYFNIVFLFLSCISITVQSSWLFISILIDISINTHGNKEKLSKTPSLLLTCKLINRIKFVNNRNLKKVVFIVFKRRQLYTGNYGYGEFGPDWKACNFYKTLILRCLNIFCKFNQKLTVVFKNLEIILKFVFLKEKNLKIQYSLFMVYYLAIKLELLFWNTRIAM